MRERLIAKRIPVGGRARDHDLARIADLEGKSGVEDV